MKPLYEATAIAVGGRNGTVRFAGGAPDLALGLPPELGGKTPDRYNPEQLMAAAYAACFHSAVQEVVRRRKQTVSEITTRASVELRTRGDAEGGFRFHVSLDVELPGLDGHDTAQILKAADAICPVADALRGTAEVTPVRVASELNREA